MHLPKFLRFLFLFLLAWCLTASAAPWQKPNAVEASLVPQYEYAVPGQTFRVGLLLKHSPKWHTYWKATGDTGLPTTLEWKLPEGWTAGGILWPVPKVFKIDGLVNYGYEDEVLLPVDLTVPASAKPGTETTLGAKVSWLMCADQCVPGEASLTLKVKVESAPGALTRSAALFEKTEHSLPGSVAVSSAVFDEKTRAVSVTFKAPRPFEHFYVFAEGEATIEYGAPQSVSRKDGLTTVTLQGTEELKPGETFSGLFVADGGPKEGGWAAEFSGTLKAGTAVAPVADSANEASHFSVWLCVVMAFIGGLILNVMPCVFPVLSLKMLNLAEHRDSRNLLGHGLTFTAGVLLSMVILAGALIAVKSAGAAVGWGFQLQSPIFVGLLALLFTAITVNMTGGFEFSGPRISGQSSSNSLLGSFATGVLAVVVASPCTAPFMGAALGYALAAPNLESLLIFLALGLGMSFPWLLISACPVLLAWLPKPGRWMNIFRTVMAVPMLLTVLWLLWVLSQQVSASAFACYIASLVLAAAALFAYGRLQWGRTAAKGFVWALGLLALGTFAAASSPIFASRQAPVVTAESWSPQAVDAALKEGRPVFVDFTASWCVTCQANKLAVLDTEKVQDAFKKAHVKFLIADWTNRNPEISAALESFGRSGVPLYVLYKPDGSFTILPELLTQDIVLKAITQATGK